MQAVTTIGLDIAKSVFQIHGVDPVAGRQTSATGEPANIDRYYLQRACGGRSAKRSADRFLHPADLAGEPVRSGGCKPSGGAGRGAVHACYRELARSFQSL